MHAPKPTLLAAAIAALALVPAAAHAETRSLEQVSVGGQGPHNSEYRASTPDGSHVFFLTDEQLVPADTDTERDVYMRAGGTTTLISGGSADEQASFDAASTDGSRVIFDTTESLSSDDTDHSIDLYEWHNGQITLLSDGQAATDPEKNVTFALATPDATHVYFSTAEAITPDDGDTVGDIFERGPGGTKRISVGLPGHDTTEGIFAGELYGVSPDGSRAYWGTAQSLSPDDTDSHYEDIFMRSGTTTTMLSDGPNDANDHVQFDAMAADGSRIAFTTIDGLDASDTDGARDVYVTDGQSAPQLVTTGTDEDLEFAAANPGLTKIAFYTDESLGSGDGDLSRDVYIRDMSNPDPALATPGTTQDAEFAAASQDLSRIFFSTEEALTSGDHDSFFDVYEQRGSSRSLVTTGPADAGDADQSLSDVSADGTRVIWTSESVITGGDDDGGLTDVYETTGGTTRLLTPASDDNDVYYGGISEDGTAVFFDSPDALTSSDTDNGGIDTFASRVNPDPPAPPTDTPTQTDSHNPPPVLGDLTAPLLKLANPGKQRILKQGGVIVTLTADEDSTATLNGTLNVPGGAKTYRFKSAKRALKAGAKAKVKLSLPKAALKKAGAALKRRKKLSAKVTVTVTDAAGNRSATKLTIGLRP